MPKNKSLRFISLTKTTFFVPRSKLIKHLTTWRPSMKSLIHTCFYMVDILSRSKRYARYYRGSHERHASQITDISTVCSTACGKHQSSALQTVREGNPWSLEFSPHKEPIMRTASPYHYVIAEIQLTSCRISPYPSWTSQSPKSPRHLWVYVSLVHESSPTEVNGAHTGSNPISSPWSRDSDDFLRQNWLLDLYKFQ